MDNYKIGQVINFRRTSWLNRLIQMGMGNYYSHTGWVVGVKDEVVYIQEARGVKGKVATNPYDKNSLDLLFNKNLIKIMDFGIKPTSDFWNYVNGNDGKPYDYVNIVLQFIRRIRRFFNKSKLDYGYNSKGAVICSELIIRGIDILTDVEVLKILNKQTFENVTPQDISVLYDKAKYLKLI